jgi:NitT/TauT family transport system substrate-binding protein
MYENIEEAAVLGKEKMNIPEKVTINSLERLNLRLVPSWEAKESIDEYLDIFYQFDKETIGGKRPDENVFYQRK